MSVFRTPFRKPKSPADYSDLTGIDVGNGIDVDEEYASSDEFQKGNKLFKAKWYYPIVKSFVIICIVFGYVLSLAMFLSPFIGWIIGNTKLIVAGIPILIFSPHLYKWMRELHKNSVYYFR